MQVRVEATLDARPKGLKEGPFYETLGVIRGLISGLLGYRDKITYVSGLYRGIRLRVPYRGPSLYPLRNKFRGAGGSSASFCSQAARATLALESTQGA